MEDIFTTSKCLSVDQIKNYLSAQLGDEEQYQIENHLLDCELCADAVEGYANHFNFEEDSQIVEKLEKAIEEKIPAKVTPVRTMERRFSWNNIAVALALLILSTAGFFYWNANQQKDLYASYFESYESNALVALRSTGDDANAQAVNVDLKQGLLLYQDKAYQKSISHFENYFQSNKENSQANFYAGMAYLETGDLPKAIQQLSKVRLNDEQSYEDATWYLILANLKKEDYTEVQFLLGDLLKIKDGFYYDRANQLKKDLK